MKRRGMGRRQVLNLNDKQDSPRRTWQTKYQQICSDNNQNGTYSDLISSTSSKPSVKNNPLSGLLGHYHSDSDTEDDISKEINDNLSSKVSDFMKEIQTIAPAESAPTSSISKTQHSTPSVDKKKGNDQMAIVGSMAWQECYDENSGYAYYWNMGTNEVTWEMPPEYQAYMESIAASQENPWAQDQHMSMAYNSHTHLMAHHHHHHHHLNHPHHHHHHIHVPGMPPALESTYDKSLGQGSRLNYNQSSNTEKNMDKKKRKNKEVDSDDEKIEMITSYGPTSDDETDEDDENESSSKKRKTSTGNLKQSKKQTTAVLKTGSTQPLVTDVEIGPKPLPASGTSSETTDDQMGEEFSGSLLLSRVQDCGAPGDDDIQEEDSDFNHKGTVYSVVNEKESKMSTSEPSKTDLYVAPDSSEEKSKSDDKASTSKTLSTVPAQFNKVHSIKCEEQDNSDEAVKSGTSTPQVIELESDVESTESDERLILTRLRNQARLLRELGGEIPDEVQHLIEPSGSSESPIQADDVIAEIEKELPPDYKTRKSEKQKECSIPKNQPASNTKNNSKISSFALIAGYGDDGDESDVEDEKRNNVRNSIGNNKIMIEKKGDKQSLFPIMCSLEKADQEKFSEMQKSSDTMGESLIGSVSSDSAIFVTGPRLPDSCEPVTSNTVSLETSLPDSTTNCKLFKRKKRLDIEVLPAVSSKQSSVITQVESENDKKNNLNPSVSSAVSSSGAYPTWTSYGADPCSSERRGFGFQSNNENQSFEQSGVDVKKVCSEGDQKTVPQKKGMINFIKAEVLNPETSSSQAEVEILHPEEKTEKPTQHDEKPAIPPEDTKGIQEGDKAVEEMAGMIREKVSFLGEGKDPVPPVQVMAIQIETLMSAWETGALSLSYWSRWLAETSTELAHLEQAAAPSGWACEWDRYSIHFNSTFCSLSCASSLYWTFLFLK